MWWLNRLTCKKKQEKPVSNAEIRKVASQLIAFKNAEASVLNAQEALLPFDKLITRLDAAISNQDNSLTASSLMQEINEILEPLETHVGWSFVFDATEYANMPLSKFLSERVKNLVEGIHKKSKILETDFSLVDIEENVIASYDPKAEFPTRNPPEVSASKEFALQQADLSIFFETLLNWKNEDVFPEEVQGWIASMQATDIVKNKDAFGTFFSWSEARTFLKDNNIDLNKVLLPAHALLEFLSNDFDKESALKLQTSLKWTWLKNTKKKGADTWDKKMADITKVLQYFKEYDAVKDKQKDTQKDNKLVDIVEQWEITRDKMELALLSLFSWKDKKIFDTEQTMSKVLGQEQLNEEEESLLLNIVFDLEKQGILDIWKDEDKDSAFISLTEQWWTYKADMRLQYIDQERLLYLLKSLPENKRDTTELVSSLHKALFLWEDEMLDDALKKSIWWKIVWLKKAEKIAIEAKSGEDGKNIQWEYTYTLLWDKDDTSDVLESIANNSIFGGIYSNTEKRTLQYPNIDSELVDFYQDSKFCPTTFWTLQEKLYRYDYINTNEKITWMFHSDMIEVIKKFQEDNDLDASWKIWAEEIEKMWFDENFYQQCKELDEAKQNLLVNEDIFTQLGEWAKEKIQRLALDNALILPLPLWVWLEFSLVETLVAIPHIKTLYLRGLERKYISIDLAKLLHTFPWYVHVEDFEGDKDWWEVKRDKKGRYSLTMYNNKSFVYHKKKKFVFVDFIADQFDNSRRVGLDDKNIILVNSKGKVSSYRDIHEYKDISDADDLGYRLVEVHSGEQRLVDGEKILGVIAPGTIKDCSVEKGKLMAQRELWWASELALDVIIPVEQYLQEELRKKLMTNDDVKKVYTDMGNKEDDIPDDIWWQIGQMQWYIDQSETWSEKLGNSVDKKLKKGKTELEHLKIKWNPTQEEMDKMKKLRQNIDSLLSQIPRFEKQTGVKKYIGIEQEVYEKRLAWIYVQHIDPPGAQLRRKDSVLNKIEWVGSSVSSFLSEKLGWLFKKKWIKKKMIIWWIALLSLFGIKQWADYVYSDDAKHVPETVNPNRDSTTNDWTIAEFLLSKEVIFSVDFPKQYEDIFKDMIWWGELSIPNTGSPKGVDDMIHQLFTYGVENNEENMKYFNAYLRHFNTRVLVPDDNNFTIESLQALIEVQREYQGYEAVWRDYE